MANKREIKEQKKKKERKIREGTRKPKAGKSINKPSLRYKKNKLN